MVYRHDEVELALCKPLFVICAEQMKRLSGDLWLMGVCRGFLGGLLLLIPERWWIEIFVCKFLAVCCKL